MNSKIILILLISQAITLANASPLLYKDFGASCDRDACASFCLKQWNPWPDGYGITPSCSVNPIR